MLCRLWLREGVLGCSWQSCLVYQQDFVRQEVSPDTTCCMHTGSFLSVTNVLYINTLPSFTVRESWRRRCWRHLEIVSGSSVQVYLFHCAHALPSVPSGNSYLFLGKQGPKFWLIRGGKDPRGAGAPQCSAMSLGLFFPFVSFCVRLVPLCPACCSEIKDCD